MGQEHLLLITDCCAFEQTHCDMAVDSAGEYEFAGHALTVVPVQYEFAGHES
jgi:hypothetical protein